MRNTSIFLAALVGCAPADLEITVSDNPDNPFSKIVSVETNADVSIRIESEMGVTPAQAPGEILVLGLAADSEHALTVLVDDQPAADVVVDTAPLEDDWQLCSVDGVGEPKEIVCTNGWIGDDGVYFCVDRDGEPIWSLQHPDGETLPVVSPLPEGGFAAVSGSKSILAIFDERGGLEAEYSMSWFSERTRYEHEFIDMHEVIPITEGQWDGAIAFLTKTTEKVDNAERQGGGVIVFDLDNQEVLWDWSVHGVMGDNKPIDPLLDYHRDGLYDEEPWDWDHVNALLHRMHDDGREEIWISMRDQDWLVSVDPDTDRVLWRLGREGDFGGSPDTWFYQQHGPELQIVDGEAHIFLFDNGTVRHDGARRSRVIELALDEEKMKVELVAELSGFYSRTGGDADLLPDGEHVQYVAGDPPSTSDTLPYIAEVSWPEGEEMWRMSCDTDQLYRAHYATSIYAQNDSSQK